MQVEASLEEATDIMRRAGLDDATRCFVPPAWLLSGAALTAVEEANFDFFELFDGIHQRAGITARALIGWGSLTPIESHMTSAYAEWMAHRLHGDTRVAIHPADIIRSSSRKSVSRVLTALSGRATMLNYAQYLRLRKNSEDETRAQ